MTKRSIIVLFCVLYNLLFVKAEEPEIGIIEKLDQFIPENIRLTDENGDTIPLKPLIDKPTVLSFVYFRCPGICTPLMNGISEVIEKSKLKLGEEYQVFTISFDPRETSDLAAKKKNNYLGQMLKKEEVRKGWKFFTSDSFNIVQLTQSTGFRYKPQGNDYLHAAALIVLSPEGKITRYLNGTYFLPLELKLAIIEASEGKSGPTINKVLQFCYSYDPTGKKYVLNITKITATLIIIIALLFFLSIAIRSQRKSRLNQKPNK